MDPTTKARVLMSSNAVSNLFNIFHVHPIEAILFYASQLNLLIKRHSLNTRRSCSISFLSVWTQANSDQHGSFRIIQSSLNCKSIIASSDVTRANLSSGVVYVNYATYPPQRLVFNRHKNLNGLTYLDNKTYLKKRIKLSFSRSPATSQLSDYNNNNNLVVWQKEFLERLHGVLQFTHDAWNYDQVALKSTDKSGHRLSLNMKVVIDESYYSHVSNKRNKTMTDDPTFLFKNRIRPKITCNTCVPVCDDNIFSSSSWSSPFIRALRHVHNLMA